MNCIKCRIRDICTIFEAVNEARKVSKGLAKIVVTECEMNPAPVTQTIQENLRPALTGIPVERRNFRDESVKAQELIEAKEKLSSKVKIASDSSDKDIKIYPNCPSCGGRTTEDDIKPCDGGCGKLTCSNCSTEDPENKQRLCQECFDKR
jgi:hypothetical protein